jgi:hypothetical protein
VFGTVTGYTITATNQILFTVQTGPGSGTLQSLAAFGAPSTYECRFSRINRSNSVLNRTFVVTPVLSGTPPVVTGIQTVNQVATGPFLSQGKFNISFPAFIPYGNVGLATLGERRMGKALSLYPGRARRRPEI